MKFNSTSQYRIVPPKERTVLKPEPIKQETKRWGKPFKDTRNWTKYNEELVVRGEFLLDMEWVKSWDTELKTMNKGKKGSPYRFPESLISLQAIWHQWIDYRGLEGITRKLAEHGLIPEHNDYSTINRRVNKTKADIKLPKSGHVRAAFDGSGMKMTNRGEYKTIKYSNNKVKKYINVKIAADPITGELLACDVSVQDEGLSEPKTAEKQIKEIQARGLNITKIWGDGNYGTHNLFNICHHYGIETAIKIKKGASSKSGGSMRRAREVRSYKKKGYSQWAKDNNYGQRWVGTEGIFSAVKRKFGENTRSIRRENICHEAKIKFWAYQRMCKYSRA